MPLSMYQASIPVLTHGLKSLSAFLDKGRANAEERKIDLAVLVNARLAPDMHPLSRQVQIASDTAKNAGARLAGIDAPSFPDTETTFDELHARIEQTVAFLGGIGDTHLDGSETRQIVLKFPGREMQFTGAEYLTTFALPNFYFHLTTVFAILRHNGVPIGKMDFMGA